MWWTREPHHPAAAGSGRRKQAPPRPGELRRQPGGRQSQHGRNRLKPQRGKEARERLAQARRSERPAQQVVVRQHAGKDRTQQALDRRPRIGILDMGAGVVDEVHVMHARGAGGHASQARQAAIDMLDHLGGRRPIVLQHVLDEINAPARRIELVSEQHVGRTGRGAEAAMHAGAQDAVRFRDIGVGELREGKGSLHWDRSPTAPSWRTEARQ